MADKISKTSQQNISDIFTNEHDKVISKGEYTYLQKKDRNLLMI